MPLKQPARSAAPETTTRNISGYRMVEVAAVLGRLRQREEMPAGVRLALIFEGGAMRGILSCAYGLALAKLTSDRHFSYILGSSAGAINALYFAAGALELGPGIYADNATDRRCTNVRKFPDVLNVDWLVDNWLFGPKSFEFSKIQNSPAEILLVLTRLDNGRPFYFDAKRTDLTTLRQAMKATSYTPLLTTRTQTIDGIEYGDGAISDAIPYLQAIALGATHIVCLVTRAPSYRKHLSRLASVLHGLRLARHTSTYREAYFRRAASYNQVLEMIYRGGPGAVPVMVIHPAASEEIPSSVETRPQTLRAIGQLAFDLADQQLQVLT